MTFTALGYPFFKYLSYTMFTGSRGVAHWRPQDGGYPMHMVNCAGEWIACLSLAIYAASFYKEFQTFSVEVCYVENDELIGEKNGDYSEMKQSLDEEDELKANWVHAWQNINFVIPGAFTSGI